LPGLVKVKPMKEMLKKKFQRRYFMGKYKTWEKGYKRYLELLGRTPEREGLQKTPERVPNL